MIPVKVCGLTRPQDALLAWELGAAALGFVFHPSSPRAITAKGVAEIRRHLPAEAFCVGVFVNLSANEVNALADEAGLSAVQLHGRETPELCATIRLPIIKAIRADDENRLDQFKVAAFLLDASHPTLHGGTGLVADWTLAARIAQRHPLVLAGGLKSDNVLEAARWVKPAALDVCSGIEAAPGVKDPLLLKDLLSKFPWKGGRPCLLPPPC